MDPLYNTENNKIYICWRVWDVFRAEKKIICQKFWRSWYKISCQIHYSFSAFGAFGGLAVLSLCYRPGDLKTMTYRTKMSRRSIRNKMALNEKYRGSRINPPRPHHISLREWPLESDFAFILLCHLGFPREIARRRRRER